MSDSALWQLVLARFRSFYREPGAVFWTFGFPLLLSVALGVAFKSRPPEPVVAAVEAGPFAEAVRVALAKSHDVRVKVLEPEAAQLALRGGRVAIVVSAAGGGGALSPTYAFDPTRPESRLARLVVDDALQRDAGRTDPTTTAELRVSEPGSRYIDSLLPGLIGMGLMSSGLWGVGYALAEMRTRKLIKRLVATPMRRTHFLLAFVLSRGLFLVVELPVLLGFGWLAFDVPLRGSLALLTGIAVLGSLTFAGLGLLVASRAENAQTAGGLVNLVTLPMFVASGTFFSAARFPEGIQPVIRALPLTALNDALRAVMLDGAGAGELLRPIAVLVVWGVASFGLALGIFRWR